MRIVREDGTDAPKGEIGEFWVADRGIVWGYYKRPDANATGYSGCCFRTRDLFVQDADGFFCIVGRIKDMIRRSGENIAAQEVEAAVNALPGILENAAVGVPDPMRGQEVKLYIRLARDTRPEDVPPEAVIAHSRERLAKFKLPRFVSYVEDFPRTVSNKIRKQDILPEGQHPRAGVWDRVEGRWLSGDDAVDQIA